MTLVATNNDLDLHSCSVCILLSIMRAHNIVALNLLNVIIRVFDLIVPVILLLLEHRLLVLRLDHLPQLLLLPMHRQTVRQLGDFEEDLFDEGFAFFGDLADVTLQDRLLVPHEQLVVGQREPLDEVELLHASFHLA